MVAAVLSAFILCLICNASALSSPSPLTGYHFGSATTAPSKKVTASDLRKKQPKAYVPDGLTEEQYRQIKNDELSKQQAMKFGMWGSRFKQMDGDPDSNWFNLPTLWTGGFTANNESVQNNVETRMGIANLLMTYMRRYGLAYLMLLLSTQLLSKSLSAKKVVSSKWVAARIVLSFTALKPMNMMASFAGRRQIGWLNKNGTTKLTGAVAVLMTVLSFALR